MSYALTDAGEEDMRAEFNALEQLNEDIDQAAALARDCDTLCPEAKTYLDLAWFATEKALRNAWGWCSAGCSDPAKCDTCKHYNELKPLAGRIGRAL